VPHNVIADDNEFLSPTLSQGQSFQQRFDTPGTYGFFCSLHAGMEGTITVQAPAQQPTQRRIFLPLVQRGGTSTTPPAQPLPPPTSPTGNVWSNPASWPGGRVPAAGAYVVIPAGRTMTLDVNTAALRALRIDGTLTFAERDLELTAGWIMVHGQGKLQIGSEARPFPNRAVITLTGAATDENVMEMGSKFLGAMAGGTIDMHSSSAAKLSWTKLAQTAQPGATSIQLLEATRWAVGDEIVLAPTGYDHTQAEVVTVTGASADGRTISFRPALQFQHWGTLQTIEGQTLDQRAEVGLLTRNIVVRSDPTSVEPFFNGRNALNNPGELAADPNRRFGGHTMIMDGVARINGVQFVDMGQATKLGRYAFHWHLTGNGSGQYIKNSSVKNGYTRGIVVHGTDGVVVENNVVYNTVSHNYIFAEDGSEDGNRFVRNLGIRTTLLPQKHRIFKDDPSAPRDSNRARRQDEHRPANFWGLSANNSFIGNVAAGGEGNGFHFAGKGNQPDLSKFEFRDNVAHSNFQTNGGNDLYPPNTRGHGIFIAPVSGAPMRLQNFTAYKNAASGVWIEGDAPVLTGSMLADNNAGVVVFAGRVENSLIIGQSANSNGQPQRLGEGRAGGIHLMRMQGGSKRPQVVNVTFVDIQDGAIVNNDLRGDLRGFAEGVRLVRTPPVLFYGVRESLMGGFVDRDGSLTGSGQPRLLLGDLALQANATCTRQAPWMAYVCPTDIPLFGLNIGSWAPRNRLDGRKDFWELPATRSDGVSGKLLVRGGSNTAGLLVAGLHYDFSLPIHPENATPTSKAMKVGVDTEELGLITNPGNWVSLSLPVESAAVFVYRELNGQFDPDDRDFRGPNVNAPLTAAASAQAVRDGDGTTFFFDAAARRVYVKLTGAAQPIYVCETANCQ
ncbi:MAG: plastocyanin/azurin family copper-binding protein, partial [Chloroflexaceae bacterium]|nr:plastocyanin/azurin family copper-binding protein [Chloroflexaceae bacterium]